MYSTRRTSGSISKCTRSRWLLFILCFLSLLFVFQNYFYLNLSRIRVLFKASTPPPPPPPPLPLPTYKHFFNFTSYAGEIVPSQNPTDYPKCASMFLKLYNYENRITPRAAPVRMIDGFLFGGEFNLLDIRLNELYDTVDLFILVESNFTLQNTPKPLYYDMYKHHFKKFHDKIVHVIVPPIAVNFSYW